MRSTGKYDIMCPLNRGYVIMKTKIIYISGNEIFDMNDIRAAFEEVRVALNLDKNTVLFGVPVDSEDAGFATKNDSLTQPDEIPETIIDKPYQSIETEPDIPEPEIAIQQNIESVVETQTESIDVAPVKKRGRPRKETVIEEEFVEDVKEESNAKSEKITDADERVVPILSVLSAKEDMIEEITDSTDEIIPEISDEIAEDTKNTEIQSLDTDSDLEKLLSAMTPLDESNNFETENIVDTSEDTNEPDISVDATLEQLATEFAEKQDKIVAETKSSSRNRIGKLRNILPFKQSKHKDTGLGDLFGWAGIAANDEEFSVPGFFTNAASRK